MPEPLVECREVSKYFPIKGLFRDVGNVRAVEQVSLTIHKHKTYGLVGESGCGKTTLARTIMRLIPLTAGEIYFNGQNILTFDKDDLMKFRRETSIVFHQPEPVLNVCGELVKERPLRSVSPAAEEISPFTLEAQTVAGGVKDTVSIRRWPCLIHGPGLVLLHDNDLLPIWLDSVEIALLQYDLGYVDARPRTCQRGEEKSQSQETNKTRFHLHLDLNLRFTNETR